MAGPIIERGVRSLWLGAEPAAEFVLSNGRLRVSVTDFGAHLADVSIVADGVMRPLTIGYPAPVRGGLSEPIGYHGATIGRYANRIVDGSCIVDGQPVSLLANDGPHALHGGPRAFDRRMWAGGAEVVGDTAIVRLGLFSPHGDLGFPGAARAQAVFALCGERLTITYEATTSAATPLNLTNHVYWNLASGGPIGGHALKVQAARVVLSDDQGVPADESPTSVAGTRFDCREHRDLASIAAGGGVDNSFVFLKGVAGPQIELVHMNGSAVSMTTNQIAAQVYLARHLPTSTGALAIEPGFPPDTPNRPEFGDCIVRPGDQYRSTTHYDFRWR